MVSIGECFSLSVYRWIGIRYGTESVESLRVYGAGGIFCLRHIFVGTVLRHCVVAMGYSYFVYFAYGGSIALSFPL